MSCLSLLETSTYLSSMMLFMYYDIEESVPIPLSSIKPIKSDSDRWFGG